MDVNAIIDERFSKWAAYLRQERATPVLVVAVDAHKGQLVFTVVNELSQADIRLMLLEAIYLIDRGLIKDMPAPEASRGLDT
jgi:hypothetical protein